MNRRVRLAAGLGRGFNWHFPARENEHRRMTPKRARQNLGALDAKANTIVFDGGKRRLRNTAQLGKLILAQTLKFAQYAHGFANRNVDTLLGRSKLLHLRSPIVMCRDGHDLKYRFVGEASIDHPKLRTETRRPMPLPRTR